MKRTLTALAVLALAACGADRDTLDRYPPGRHACILGDTLIVTDSGQWAFVDGHLHEIIGTGTKLDLAHAGRDLCGLR